MKKVFSISFNVFLFLIVFILFIKMYILDWIRIDGDSMLYSLNSGDYVLINKINTNYKRFDIVVIKEKKNLIVKRIIGLPNENIRSENNTIFINGNKLLDIYGNGITNDFDEIKLSKNQYFLLGDNRQISLDSRYYGPFTKNSIIGKVIIVK